MATIVRTICRAPGMFFLYVTRMNDEASFSGPFTTSIRVQDTASQMLTLANVASVEIYDKESFMALASSHDDPDGTDEYGMKRKAHELAARLDLSRPSDD